MERDLFNGLVSTNSDQENRFVARQTPRLISRTIQRNLFKRLLWQRSGAGEVQWCECACGCQRLSFQRFDRPRCMARECHKMMRSRWFHCRSSVQTNRRWYSPDSKLYIPVDASPQLLAKKNRAGNVDHPATTMGIPAPLLAGFVGSCPSVCDSSRWDTSEVWSNVPQRRCGGAVDEAIGCEPGSVPGSTPMGNPG